MARLARVVVSHPPDKFVPRGNRRTRTLFVDDDYILYLRLLKSAYAAVLVRDLGYLGNAVFLERLERKLGCALKPAKRGPKVTEKEG